MLAKVARRRKRAARVLPGLNHRGNKTREPAGAHARERAASANKAMLDSVDKFARLSFAKIVSLRCFIVGLFASYRYDKQKDR
jgi:hypothetical protein